VLSECDGVLSGYMGSVDIGEAILESVAAVKEANPAARYCCDTVIGDVEQGVFVRAGIPEFMRERALPAADLVTPNQFELDTLAQCETSSLADLCAAIDTVHARGPRVILVTSVQTRETPMECLDVVASDEAGKFRLRTPRLPMSVNGAGDAIAALFFIHHLRTGSSAEALSRAVSSIFCLLSRTAEAGSREILLIDGQDELIRPGEVFEALPI
jgi:pyridoxine kinase